MLEDVKERVRQVGVKSITLSEVADFGGTGGQLRIYRTLCVVNSVSRVRIQTIVDEDMVGPVVDAIMACARRRGRQRDCLSLPSGRDNSHTNWRAPLQSD
jgi:nitrogen regulatory protein PII